MKTKRFNLMVPMVMVIVAVMLLFTGIAYAEEAEEKTTLVWASYAGRNRVEAEGLDLVLKEENLISLDTEYKTFGNIGTLLENFFIETNQGYFMAPITSPLRLLSNRVEFDGFERVYINLYEKAGETYIGLYYPDRIVDQYGGRGGYELYNYIYFHFKYVNGFNSVPDYFYTTAKEIEFHNGCFE